MRRCATGFALAFLSTVMGGAAQAQEKSFDRIVAAFTPHLDANDPLGLPMKVRTLSESPYKFWRGSKDSFFAWSRDNCRDWWMDNQSFITQQGDLHLGNVGTYAINGATGTLSFGLVDFDDSAKVPVGLEVLQGLVTLRVLAADRKLNLSANQLADIDRTFCEIYERAFAGGKSADELLRNDPSVKKLFENEREEYHKVLAKFCEGQKFRRVIGGDKPRDVLLKRAEGTQGIAAALEQLFRNHPQARGMLRLHQAKEIEPHIRDVAFRVRLASSGSQGQRKIFVLLDAAAAGNHDVILYFKETIPSAAVRSGLVKDTRNPAQRLVEDTNLLTSPQPGWAGGGWTRLDGRDFWVSLHEGWSSELDPQDVNDFQDLHHVAQILGVAAGASHQGEAAARVKAAVNATMMAEAKTRAALFTEKLKADFADFIHDERTQKMAMTADAHLRSLLGRQKKEESASPLSKRSSNLGAD